MSTRPVASPARPRVHPWPLRRPRRASPHWARPRHHWLATLAPSWLAQPWPPASRSPARAGHCAPLCSLGFAAPASPTVLAPCPAALALSSRPQFPCTSEEEEQFDVWAQGISDTKGEEELPLMGCGWLLLGRNWLAVGPAQQIHRGALPNSFLRTGGILDPWCTVELSQTIFSRLVGFLIHGGAAPRSNWCSRSGFSKLELSQTGP